MTDDCDHPTDSVVWDEGWRICLACMTTLDQGDHHEVDDEDDLDVT